PFSGVAGRRRSAASRPAWARGSAAGIAHMSVALQRSCRSNARGGRPIEVGGGLSGLLVRDFDVGQDIGPIPSRRARHPDLDAFFELVAALAFRVRLVRDITSWL